MWMAHIRTATSPLYRYQKTLLEGGYIYIACPPLSKVERVKIHTYLRYNEQISKRNLSNGFGAKPINNYNPAV